MVSREQHYWEPVYTQWYFYGKLTSPSINFGYNNNDPFKDTKLWLLTHNPCLVTRDSSVDIPEYKHVVTEHYFALHDMTLHTHMYVQNYIYTCINACVHTGCPRRNGQNFGRVFLMLKYTDITQNTYVQSWTVTEIKAREKCGLFDVPRTVPGSRGVIPIRCALSVLVYSWLKRVPRYDCTCKVLGNPKDNYDVSARVFVVQFNGFMSQVSLMLSTDISITETTYSCQF